MGFCEVGARSKACRNAIDANGTHSTESELDYVRSREEQCDVEGGECQQRERAWVDVNRNDVAW
eukprot:CAMPEP_0175836792 /NCGR_PEP_ID=MMETSP0107_2-20121207/17336_1 /TAXON_ID=195067 ORGANISM="Goniomonas pacifica, Strain CCMP1869" /NCGR_SAMPLE_ID=MMETSP0107_2 /ASSEMBLY_ACC=CAM_ASM_000203 /LENGTH=63 /DNA_ID=CAMNT_0017150219 /DNA_START=367 /DNA_END=555 /DNA_ORIENTATION=+